MTPTLLHFPLQSKSNAALEHCSSFPYDRNRILPSNIPPHSLTKSDTTLYRCSTFPNKVKHGSRTLLYLPQQLGFKHCSPKLSFFPAQIKHGSRTLLYFPMVKLFCRKSLLIRLQGQTLLSNNALRFPTVSNTALKHCSTFPRQLKLHTVLLSPAIKVTHCSTLPCH